VYKLLEKVRNLNLAISYSKRFYLSAQCLLREAAQFSRLRLVAAGFCKGVLNVDAFDLTESLAELELVPAFPGEDSSMYHGPVQIVAPYHRPTLAETVDAAEEQCDPGFFVKGESMPTTGLRFETRSPRRCES
jgi:hypothetical protein